MCVIRQIFEATLIEATLRRLQLLISVITNYAEIRFNSYL